jgi:Leucine Rich repeat
MNRWTFIALALLVSSCASKTSDTRPSDEPDFSLPADAHVKEGHIQSRADLEALAAETTFITSGDHGSVELSSDDLQVLARFTRLKRLHLRHCRGIGNAGMDYIATHTGLEDLDLSGCVALTGDGIAKLATLRNLRELRINFCPKITRSEVEQLQRAMPRADIVWSSDDPPLGAPPNHPGR